MKKKYIIIISIVIIILLVLVGFILSRSSQAPLTEITPTVQPTVTDQMSQLALCDTEPTTWNRDDTYYRAGSPERTTIAEGIPGEKLIITGYVFDTTCKPLANVWLDFWQADSYGTYDTQGFQLRGHQYTDQAGRYTLTTIMPAPYGDRAPHINVKVQKDNNSPALTTQLFFADLSKNETDSYYDESLILNMQKTANGNEATFNLKLEQL